MEILGIILLILGGIGLLLVAYYLIAGRIFFNLSFSRRTQKTYEKQNNATEKMKEYKVDLAWWDTADMEEVWTKSFDGLSLSAYFYNKKSSKTAILCHGYGADHKEMQQYAKYFCDNGYNVLCVDARAHGKSEGKCIGFGYLDRLDILKWIEFINEKVTSKIVLFGVSMGASAVCSAAGENLPKNVVAVIADAPFDVATKQLAYTIRKTGFLKNYFVLHLASYIRRAYGINLNEFNIVQKVKNTKIPILYIHGKKDTVVPFECSVNLYNNTPENLRELRLVDEAKHITSYPILGVEYERIIDKFLRKYQVFGGVNEKKKGR